MQEMHLQYILLSRVNFTVHNHELFHPFYSFYCARDNDTMYLGKYCAILQRAVEVYSLCVPSAGPNFGLGS